MYIIIYNIIIDIYLLTPNLPPPNSPFSPPSDDSLSMPGSIIGAYGGVEEGSVGSAGGGVDHFPPRPLIYPGQQWPQHSTIRFENVYLKYQ